MKEVMEASSMIYHCEPRLNANARLGQSYSKLPTDRTIQMIRARFDKRSTLAFLKVDIRNEPLPDSLLCQLRCISRAAHLPTSSADTIGIL